MYDMRNYKDNRRGDYTRLFLMAIIQRRRPLRRVVNIEVHTWRTSVRKGCRSDAVLDRRVVVMHGSRLLVIVVLMDMLVVVLCNRGMHRRGSRRRSAGSIPCEFREVGERGYILAEMTMHFLGTRRRGLDNHGHGRLCCVAIVGRGRRWLVVPQPRLPRTILLLSGGAREGIEVQVLRRRIDALSVNAVRRHKCLGGNRLPDSRRPRRARVR